MFQQIAQKVAELPARVKQTSVVLAALVGLTSCGTMPYQQGGMPGYGYNPAPAGNPLAQSYFPQSGFGGQGVVTQNSSNFSSTGFSNRRTVDYGNRIVTTNNRTSTRGFSNTTHTYNPITGESSTINVSMNRNGKPQFSVSTRAPRNVVNPAAIERAAYLSELRKEQAAERAAIYRAAKQQAAERAAMLREAKRRYGNY